MATEKRLIDANALLRKIRFDHDRVMQDPEIGNPTKWRESVCYQRTVRAVKKAPTIDAVEVIRCKDCKYYVLHAGACRHENFNGIIHMNGYCSQGERKDND